MKAKSLIGVNYRLDTVEEFSPIKYILVQNINDEAK
jgi:hypothetical protein